MNSPTRHRWIQTAAIAAGLVVLTGVFLLYTQPSFMVTLIDQVWSCF
jgi:hypothetical protein